MKTTLPTPPTTVPEHPDISIPGLSNQALGFLVNVRTYKQYLEMYRWNESGECGFCVLNTQLNTVLHETENWRTWRNPFPAAHTKHHFVIAHKQHVLTLGAAVATGNEFMELVGWLNKNYDLEGGGVLMRFGNPWLNAGSVAHQHGNVIVPDGTGEVRLPLAKDKEDIEEKMKIVRVFEKLRLGTMIGSLSEEELKLIYDRH